jgi:hypothetical protein
VVVAFDFPYEQPTQTLFAFIQFVTLYVCLATYLHGKATSAVKPLARIDVGLKKAFRVIKKVD